MSAAPRRSHRRLLLRVIQVALVAAAAYFIARYLADSWTAVTDYEWRLRPVWLAASAALFLAYFLLNGLGWWLILRGCGLPAGRSRAIATWGTSILARYVPGTVWMFAGRLWMSREQGLEVERVSAAMVYEQALGVAAALVTTALLFPFWDWQRGATALALLAIPAIVALLHPRPFARLAGWGLRLLRRPPLAQVLPFRLVLGLLAYFVVIWLVGGLACWTLAAAVTEVTAAPRRPARGHRRLRLRLRCRHGSLLRPQRDRRPRGRDRRGHGQYAARRCRARVRGAPAALADGDRARLRGRGHGVRADRREATVTRM